MPRGELHINGVDAYTMWGMSLTDGSLSQLMSFPGLKDRVENESRLDHGKRVLNEQPRWSAREVTLEMHISAPDRAALLSRYEAVMEVLSQGRFDVRSSLYPGVTFKMLYKSCTQFAQYERLAKFALRVEEPNPGDR